MAAALLSLTDCCAPCDVCEVEIVSASGSGITGWFYVKSAAEARAIASADTNKVVEINGFVTGGVPGDTGTYTWDASSNEGDSGDGGQILLPNDNPATGRWNRKI